MAITQDHKLGVLLTNLGSPQAPTTPAVRRYLRQFLSDRRVVNLPRALWLTLLYLVILPLRSPRSAKKYQTIWTKQGSPLIVHSQRQCHELAQQLKQRTGFAVPVALGMNYGQPSISQALESLRDQGIERLVVLPLFPQYSATTTGASFDGVSHHLQQWPWLPHIEWISCHHDHPDYIKAMAAHIKQYFESNGQSQRLLFSFHGLPKQNLAKGDPYFCHCHKTARLLAATLQLTEDQWALSFQSRFGRAEWLTPYTDKTLQDWASKGLESVAVFCPGFAADCLETLEEIAMENRHVFLEHGGKQFNYIPALNDNTDYMVTLANLCLDSRPQPSPRQPKEQVSQWLHDHPEYQSLTNPHQ